MNTFEIIKVATREGFEMYPNPEGMVFMLRLHPQKIAAEKIWIMGYKLGSCGVKLGKIVEIKADDKSGIVIQTDIIVQQSG